MSDTIHLSGDFYIEPFVNGVSGGIIGPIDVDSLQVKPDANKISVLSKRIGRYGQPRETYFTAKPAIITIKTTEIPPVMLAAAFMAESESINQGSGSLTDEAVTLPAYPKWVSLSKTNLASTGLTVTKDAAPLVLNTDFEINYALGMIRAAANGSVKDGGAVTVSATYNAVTGTRMNGNVQPDVKARLILDGESIIDGKKTILRVPQASLSPTDAVDFMSDNPMEITLEGECIFVDGETAAYYVEQPEETVA